MRVLLHCWITPGIFCDDHPDGTNTETGITFLFLQVPQVFARGARARGAASDRRVHGRGAAQHSEGFRLLHGALLTVCLLFVFIRAKPFQTTAVLMQSALYAWAWCSVFCMRGAGHLVVKFCMCGARTWYVLYAQGRTVECSVCASMVQQMLCAGQDWDVLYPRAWCSMCCMRGAGHLVVMFCTCGARTWYLLYAPGPTVECSVFASMVQQVLCVRGRAVECCVCAGMVQQVSHARGRTVVCDVCAVMVQHVLYARG